MKKKQKNMENRKLQSNVLGDKMMALQSVLETLNKQFGKGAVMLLGEDGPKREIRSHSTGSLNLDRALGINGLPQGRVCEIFGPESSGKTTISLSTIAQVQKKGGVAVFIDAEHALDLEYAKVLGVDTESLIIAQPDSGEQALEICESLVRSAAVDIVVVDSVAALVPRAEIEGDMGDSHMGLQARLMSQALRKLTGIIARTGTTVIFINQLRQKIGVMFGNPEVTTGGNALKFYSSVRLDIRRIEKLKNVDGPTGAKTRVRVVKNKMAPPFKEAIFDLMYGEGICRNGELLDLALEEDIVNRSGSWFSFGDLRLGQGREKVKEYLQQNPKIAADIEEIICLSDEKKKVVDKTNKNTVDSKIAA